MDKLWRVLIVTAFAASILATFPQHAKVAAVEHSRLKADSMQENNSITVRGCLSGDDRNGFYITDLNSDVFHQKAYQIIGQESRVRQLAIDWDSVEITGTVEKEGSTTSIRVSEIKVVHKPIPRKPEFGTSGWSSYKSAKYGIGLRYPKALVRQEDSQEVSANRLPNLVDPAGTTNLISLQIPREIFPNTAFAGGSVTVRVGNGISNAPTCGVFGQRYVKSPEPRGAHGVRYSEAIVSGVGLGTSYPGYYFHTFQNGWCYEVEIEFAEGNIRNWDGGCESDTVNDDALVDAILSHVSFGKPAASIVSKQPAKSGVPTITSLQAIHVTPIRIIPQVNVSWVVEGADYVTVTFNCDPNIGTAEREVECPPVTYAAYTYGPQGSIATFFQNRNLGPASVSVTLQPFVNGIGNPQWSKTIDISIPPIS